MQRLPYLSLLLSSLLLLASGPSVAAESALDKEEADYKARREAKEKEEEENPRAPNTRDTWFIGFGFHPVGSLKIDGAKAPDEMSFSEGNFMVGATLRPNLLLGGEILSATVSQEEKSGGVETRYSISATHIGPVLVYFPTNTGPFLKAAVYHATLTYAVEIGELESTASDSGNGVGLGAGYAFWLGETFNLNVELNYGADRFSGDGPDKASYTSFGLGFYWY